MLPGKPKWRMSAPSPELRELRVGPVGLALQDVDKWTRTQLIKAVRPAFDAHVQGSTVRFTAACWSVSTRVSSGSVATK
jgi:hypothetical protein